MYMFALTPCGLPLWCVPQPLSSRIASDWMSQRPWCRTIEADASSIRESPNFQEEFAEWKSKHSNRKTCRKDPGWLVFVSADYRSKMPKSHIDSGGCKAGPVSAKTEASTTEPSSTKTCSSCVMMQVLSRVFQQKQNSKD